MNLDNINIKNTQSVIKYKNKKNNQKYYKNNSNKTDSFETTSKNKKSKKYKKYAILAAAILALQSCQKNNNVYDNIENTTVNLNEFSDDYFYEYNSTDKNTQDTETAQKKADFLASIPVIGSYLYSNKGLEFIENAVADEGTEINGYIDNNIVQGIVRDCWLITPIENLSYTPLGAEMLHDAMSVNKDGNIDVYFKGPDLTYTVTLDEIDKANKEYSIYSRGDDDMLVYELAVEKFRQDLADEKIEIDENLPSYLYYTNTNGYNTLHLGETRQAYWLLTGITESIEAKTEEEIDEVLKKFKDSPETSLLDVELKKNAQVKDINGKTTYIYGSHGYGVKEITDKNITLIGASYSNEKIVLPIDTLKNLPLECLIYCEIK